MGRVWEDEPQPVFVPTTVTADVPRGMVRLRIGRRYYLCSAEIVPIEHAPVAVSRVA